MRVRTRFGDLIKARCAQLLPEALATVWDKADVVCAIESLKFMPGVGHVDPDWALEAQFEGVLRVELHANGIDTLLFEPLLASLIAEPPILRPNADAEAGDMSERARAILIELRDTVRDREVVTALRFTLNGDIITRDPEPVAPEALISQAPDIGLGHEEDYTPITGEAGAA